MPATIDPSEGPGIDFVDKDADRSCRMPSRRGYLAFADDSFENGLMPAEFTALTL